MGISQPAAQRTAEGTIVRPPSVGFVGLYILTLRIAPPTSNRGYVVGYHVWGFPSSHPISIMEHGLGRPCFLEGIWSLRASKLFPWKLAFLRDSNVYKPKPLPISSKWPFDFSSGCHLALERVSYDGTSWWRFLFVVGLSNGRKHEGRFTFGTIELNESTLLLPITDNDNTCIHVRRCYPNSDPKFQE